MSTLRAIQTRIRFADDTKLSRNAAIKVLPDSFAQDGAD
jgi:hypothetical protein